MVEATVAIKYTVIIESLPAKFWGKLSFQDLRGFIKNLKSEGYSIVENNEIQSLRAQRETLEEQVGHVTTVLHEAETRLKALSPAPISEMPGEWKDGRDLLVRADLSKEWFLVNWHDEMGFLSEHGSAISGVQHVMLPPTIGERDEG